MIYPTLHDALMAQYDVEGLAPVQLAQYAAAENIVKQYGQYDWTTGANGSHYTPENVNPFIAEGLVCANCVFYENNQCEIVSGVINPNAICKFWIIPENKLNLNKAGSESG